MLSRNLKTLTAFLALCLLTVIIYTPGLSGDYMFDDIQNLLKNNRLVIKTLDTEALQAASFSSGAGKLRRPVSMFSFALNRYFFGIDPYSYKLTNLVIHLLTGLMLLLLSQLILRNLQRHGRVPISTTAASWLPVLVAGIWLVHPLNLTGVLYIVQRMTSLSALFTVMGLCCYVLGRQRLLEQRSGWPWIITGLLIFGSLAILSKENGALLPVYMGVIELAVFRFANREGHIDKPVAGFFCLLLVLPAVAVLVLLAVQPDTLLRGYTGRVFTLTERVLTETRVLVFYLQQIIAPSINKLGLYHDDIQVSSSLLKPITTLYSTITLASLLTAALLLVKKLPLFSLGVLWFFVGHVLESTILPLELAHEHRNYLADYGIILALAALVTRLPGQQLGTWVKTATPALFICLLAYTTLVRSGQWSSNVDHAVFEALHHPGSPRSAHAAGRIHARLAVNGKTESLDRAFYYFERASILDKSGIISDAVMIKLAFMFDRPVQQGWYNRIISKLTHHPINASTINGLQTLADCQRNVCRTPTETMETIYATVLNNDSLKISKTRRSNAYTSYGYYSINVQGDFHKGRDYLTLALETKPDEPQWWINLIKLHVAMHDHAEAELRLNEFRSADTHGAGRRDFERLQKAIDKDRMNMTTSAAAASNTATGQ